MSDPNPFAAQLDEEAVTYREVINSPEETPTPGASPTSPVNGTEDGGANAFRVGADRPGDGIAADRDQSAPPVVDDAQTHSGLMQLAEQSRVPFKHLSALMAAAQLDLQHSPDKQVGYRELFEATCRSGTTHWMDPMPLLHEINNVLRQFLAPRETVTPIIAVLVTLAEHGVSPYAVLDYVVLPRLRQDKNWRRWGAAHLPVINSVAGVLTLLRSDAPFHKPYLGTASHPILTDVFLVKYIASALVGRAPREFTPAVVEHLVETWRSLPARTHGFIVFLRLNLRPFLAVIGKKLDATLYLQIVEQLQPIEASLHAHAMFHDGNRVYESSLYGSDPGVGVEKRDGKNYKPIHFLREFRSYQNIVTILLSRQGGRAALTYVGSSLQRIADPEQAQNVEQLIRVLQDRGGRHIYVWHVSRLLAHSAAEQEDWMQRVVQAGGAHPDYPHYDQLFAHQEFRHAQNSLGRLASELGLVDGSQAGSLSPAGLVRAYVRRTPESANLVERFQRDLSGGVDREWTRQDAIRFDSLEKDGNRSALVHALLLYATIRGFSGAYSRGVHTAGLVELMERFQPEPIPSALDYRRDFTRSDLFSAQETQQKNRAKVKTDAIAAVWTRIAEATEAPPLDQAIGTQYRTITEQLAESRENRGPEHVATRRLGDQQAALQAVLDDWTELPEAGRLSCGLILAGYFGRKAEGLRSAALAYSLAWARSDPVERERLKYLSHDIDAETINRRQTEYLVTALTDISERLAGSADVNEWMERIGETGDSLAPLTLTKQKEVTPEALDAAFRAVVNLSTLGKELARWRELPEVGSDSTTAGPGGTGRPQTGQAVAARSGGARTGDDGPNRGPPGKHAGQADGPDSSGAAGGSAAGSLGPGRDHHYVLYTSRTSLDAYFGDMGGTCLSASPHHVVNKGFFNIRLADLDRNEIVGMAALQYVNGTVASVGIRGFWFAFAFNPLRSITSGLTVSQLRRLYELFRSVLKYVAGKTRRPVLIPGIAAYGVVSNDTAFANLIIEYEKEQGGRFVNDAYGFALQYDEKVYSQALVLSI